MKYSKKKHSICLLIAAILTSLYLIFLFSTFTNELSATTDTASTVGIGLAGTLLFPSILVAGIGLIFNYLAFFLNKSGFALTTGILYAVSMLLFPLYFFFMLIQMILAFIGYSKVKKINEQKTLQTKEQK